VQYSQLNAPSPFKLLAMIFIVIKLHFKEFANEEVTNLKQHADEDEFQFSIEYLNNLSALCRGWG